MLGFLFFLGIGIAINGFHYGDASQRTLTTFGVGRRDHLAPRFDRIEQRSEALRIRLVQG